MIVPSRMPGTQWALSKVNLNLKRKSERDAFDRKPKTQWLIKEEFTSLSCEILWNSWQSWNDMVALLCEALRDPDSFQLCSAITGVPVIFMVKISD